MINFMFRNLKVFFRDRSAVLFALLIPFGIIGLYVLFLGDVWTGSVAQYPGARELIDNWMVAGMLSVTSVTSAMGAFGIMIDDRISQVQKDILTSPVPRYKIGGGYFLSTYLIGVVLSLVTMILAEGYIILDGGEVMGIVTFMRVMCVLLLAVLANTSLVFFLSTFFDSEHAFGIAGTVVGTLIGFITGIYLPIGELPDAVQWIVKLFPPSHAAVLLRKIMTYDQIGVTFAGASEETVAKFCHDFGVTFAFWGEDMTFAGNAVVLFGSAVFFFVLALGVLSRKRR